MQAEEAAEEASEAQAFAAFRARAAAEERARASAVAAARAEADSAQSEAARLRAEQSRFARELLAPRPPESEDPTDITVSQD